MIYRIIFFIDDKGEEQTSCLIQAENIDSAQEIIDNFVEDLEKAGITATLVSVEEMPSVDSIVADLTKEDFLEDT
jgi:hypothetical protein